MLFDTPPVKISECVTEGTFKKKYTIKYIYRSTMAHTPKERKAKLHELENQIKEDESIQKKDLLAQMSYQWGFTKRTAKDYIETLKSVNKIKETDEGKIKHHSKVGEEN